MVSITRKKQIPKRQKYIPCKNSPNASSPHLTPQKVPRFCHPSCKPRFPDWEREQREQKGEREGTGQGRPKKKSLMDRATTIISYYVSMQAVNEEQQQHHVGLQSPPSTHLPLLAAAHARTRVLHRICHDLSQDKMHGRWNEWVREGLNVK